MSTTVGVTKTTSSVSLFWKRLERNSAPSTGMSPSSGTLSMLVEFSRWIRPLSTMVSPLRTLNSVVVLRDSRAGPEGVETDGSIWLNSVSMRARITPLGSTLGWISNRTP